MIQVHHLGKTHRAERIQPVVQIPDFFRDLRSGKCLPIIEKGGIRPFRLLPALNPGHVVDQGLRPQYLFRDQKQFFHIIPPKDHVGFVNGAVQLRLPGRGIPSRESVFPQERRVKLFIWKERLNLFQGNALPHADLPEDPDPPVIIKLPQLFFHIFHGAQHLGRNNGLGQVIQHPAPEGVPGILKILVAADNAEAQIRPHPAGLPDQLQTVFHRHLHVRQHQIRGRLLDQLQRLAPVPSSAHHLKFRALIFYDAANGLDCHDFVVYNDDFILVSVWFHCAAPP